jgi:hypothetical protein
MKTLCHSTAAHLQGRRPRANRVWELEALDPKVLQKLLTAAIDGVIDRRAFNAEVAQERTDAAHNAVVREIILRTLREEVTTER